MERTPRKILFQFIGVVFFIFVIFFSYTRFGRYITGPEISEINLEKYQIINSSYKKIEGKIKNVETINIQGRTITYDKDNSFSDVIVFSPGYTIIDIVLTDSFGKERIYSYTIETTITKLKYETIFQDRDIRKQDLAEISETEINL